MISVTMQISEFEHAIPGAGEWLWLFGEVKTPQFQKMLPQFGNIYIYISSLKTGEKSQTVSLAFRQNDNADEIASK